MEEILEKHNISNEAKEEILRSIEESYPEKAKPLFVTSEKKFNEYMVELLKLLPSYRLMDQRQKVLTETCKNYMIENKIGKADCDYGSLTLIQVFQRRLDRNLIEDIEKYKTLQSSDRLGKQPNQKAFNEMN